MHPPIQNESTLLSQEKWQVFFVSFDGKMASILVSSMAIVFVPSIAKWQVAEL